MNYVFILQHGLKLLAACCNLTNHLSKCHTGMSTPFKYSIPPGCQLHLWRRCSDPQNSMENWADLWVTLWKVYWVCKKKKIWLTKVLSVWWLPRWSFYKRQFSSEMEEIIWQLFFLFKRGNLGTLLKRVSFRPKSTDWGTFLLGDGMVTPIGTD